jgi:hypothetical protein
MTKKLVIGALLLAVAVLLAGLIVPRRPRQPQFRTEKVVRG